MAAPFQLLNVEGVADVDLVSNKRCNKLPIPVVLDANEGLHFLEVVSHRWVCLISNLMSGAKDHAMHRHLTSSETLSESVGAEKSL